MTPPKPPASVVELKCEKIAMRAVSIVSRRMSKDGKLYAYDGIEAAREIRDLLIKNFAKKPRIQGSRT